MNILSFLELFKIKVEPRMTIDSNLFSQRLNVMAGDTRIGRIEFRDGGWLFSTTSSYCFTGNELSEIVSKIYKLNYSYPNGFEL